jgi:hypothetical protein
MMDIKRISTEAARLSKGLNREESLNSEYVAIWADGSVSLIDCGTEARGSGQGFEYPVASIRQPYRVADVVQLLNGRGLALFS